jgi:uroporphyrinogen-III synthase
VVVLRPEPGATATVKRARERGLDALALPLFEIEPVRWSPPDPAPFDGLLLTSANAARYAGEGLREFRGLPVYAVGEATAEAARNAGFDVGATGESDVERLLHSIDPDLKLLHLCGQDRKVAQARQEIVAVPVYRSNAKDGVDLAPASGSVALVHSPRSGGRLAELASERGSIAIAAISPAAATAVGNGWEAVRVADVPTDDALLALAARLCNISAAQ